MPLANEFQRKQQLQAKEFAATNTPQEGPKEHPEDILVVRNILVGDDTDVEEVIPYANARPSTDPGTGQQHFVNQIDTNVYEHSWNTKDFFEVRWDGRPHRVRAGETRRMPRYLADHFAKHLIDFILIKRESSEKVTGLLKNRGERAKLYQQIIVDVDSYYNGDLWDYEREGTYVEQQVDQMNRSDSGPAFNLGEVPPVALGYGINDTPPESVEPPAAPEVAPEAPATPPQSRDEAIAGKSRNQFLQEAKQLGIQLTGRETKEQLYDAITNF